MNASTNTPACVNPEDDVIDRIDELVTESLSKPWDQISGYDNDINQESCGHCGRAWHGLPLGVCPGATFIGRRAMEAISESIGVLQVTRWLAPDEPEPPTPQQRALPRPSSTPPMWAQQPNQRRRRNRM